MRRDAVIGERANWRDRSFARKDYFAACPRMVDLRRASLVELRSALLRVKAHVPLANTSGLGDVLGQGSEAPSDWTSLLSTSAQLRGSGARLEQVALGSVDRIRLSRAPHKKYKYLLGAGAQSSDRDSEYFCRVSVDTGSPSVRAVAQEAEFFREAAPIPFTPLDPLGKGLAPPAIRPEGLAIALGFIRTFSRMVKDAARVETPF